MRSAKCRRRSTETTPRRRDPTADARRHRHARDARALLPAHQQLSPCFSRVAAAAARGGAGRVGRDFDNGRRHLRRCGGRPRRRLGDRLPGRGLGAHSGARPADRGGATRFAAVDLGGARRRRRQGARHEQSSTGPAEGSRHHRHGLARDEPALVPHMAAGSASDRRSSGSSARSPEPPPRRAGRYGGMTRIPLLSGSRVPLVTLADDAVLLAPPPPLDPLRDVAAAVGEALRYPLSGSPVADFVTRGGRVTIVVEPRSLPSPGRERPAPGGGRSGHRRARSARMPAERHTILIAGGLERRAGRRELEAVLRPM